MGEKKLNHEIITIEELIASKRFDSIDDVYRIPDSILPRVRVGGKIKRPIRFYLRDIERLFSKPLDEQPRTVVIEQARAPMARPSIQFKKRR